ncbi:MAG TPA: peptidase S10 [Rhodanobacteraceae bacterium]
MIRAGFIIGAFVASVLCGAPVAAPAAATQYGELAPPIAHATPRADMVARLMSPMRSVTYGSVTIEGRAVKYEAVAGTLVIRANRQGKADPEVAMGYEAYFKQGAGKAKRPITFLYNGGPGFSSLWLLMGAFGPERIVTRDHTQTPAAPYRLVNNEYSLLDASDLIFIDAPGTGFGRLLPRGKTRGARARDLQRLAKRMWSVDGDARVFARFIVQFLSKYDRWNSPKYLYGESYGTTRTAVLANDLEQSDDVDLNGLIFQSQVLNFGLSIDGARRRPGDDIAYVTALPTFAATAWYHRRLPKLDSQGLEPLLQSVTRFATDRYERALFAGSTLSKAAESRIARKLHDFTGLPTAYWVKADLRVSGGMFEHELLSQADLTTGRLDTRFAGPSMNPMSRSRAALYDPQMAAINSAYVAGFNEYMRTVMKFGKGMHYRPTIYALPTFHWGMAHRVAGTRTVRTGTLNVMPDLADAMKFDPDMKVMLNGGLYDLATPFYTAIYEEEHLQIPRSLDRNITYAFYPSGHMIYVHVPSLHALHDNVARFIDDTDNVK